MMRDALLDLLYWRWFDPSWYAYLFERPTTYARGSCGNYWITDWAGRLWCRLRSHPAGPAFYNAGGLEPDPRCKNCGDECA